MSKWCFSVLSVEITESNKLWYKESNFTITIVFFRVHGYVFCMNAELPVQLNADITVNTT